MSVDDTNPGSTPDPEHRPADPFQELERMFGSHPAPVEEAASPASVEEPETPAAPQMLAETSSPQVTHPEPKAPGPKLEALVAALDAATPTVPALAGQSAETAEGSGAAKRHVVFSIGDARYALDMGSVIEVGPVPPVTPLPMVPSWLLGVSNLRGDILAVLDLGIFLDPSSPATNGRRMLVVRTGAARLSAGMVVDDVHGAAKVDPEGVRPPTAPVDGPVQAFLRGVTEHDGRLLAILDAEKLLNASELRSFADATSSNTETTIPPRAERSDSIDPSPIL